MAIKISSECRRCALCMAKCPERAITYDRDLNEENFRKYPVKIDTTKCTNCKLCISAGFCPIGAITEE